MTREEIAAALVPRRDELVRRLPGEIRAAGDLPEHLQELVIDDGLIWLVVDNRAPVATIADAEALLWGFASNNVKDALKGRHDTVRGQYRAVPLETAASVAQTRDDPVAESERRLDRAVLAEFILTLEDTERAVMQRKWRPELTRPAGWRTIARELGLSVARVRQAERSSGAKLKDFAAAYAGGTLCEERTAELAKAAAAGADTGQAARAHIGHCTACEAGYAAQLRATRSGELPREIASMLPVPPLAETIERHGGGVRDLLSDLVARLLGNDTAGSVAGAVASGMGRGSGALVALKVAALLAAGTSATIGAGIGAGVLDGNDRPRARATATPSPTPQPPVRTPAPLFSAADEAALERSIARAEARARAAAERRRRARARRRAQQQAATGPAAQEQDVPVSPAPAGALPNGGSEFSPDGAALQPAPPAPPPTAPGASEFGP